MKKRGSSKKTKRSGRRRLKNPPKVKRKSRLRFWFKAHGGATAFFLVSYLVLGLMISPDFLRKDLEGKYGKVAGAVNVSVLVRGMPQKPVVSATSGCDGSYPYIDLDWADDLGVDTFDVWRDGALLVTGLTSSSYRDTNVNVATTYAYYVAAHGPLGDEQSDEISAATETECYIPPPPPPPPVVIDQVTIGGIDVTNFQCCPQVKEKRPVFSGTTNVSRARVAVGIQSGRHGIISTFSANQNGYWSWKLRSKLPKGMKTFYLTIVDPNDASRVVSTSFQFKIAKRKMKKKTLAKCMGGTVLKDITTGIHPFFINHLFRLAVESQGRTVHPGEVLGFSLSRFQGNYPQPAGASYKLEVLDGQGNLIYEGDGRLGAQSQSQALEIEKKVAPGKYRLIARYFGGDLDISAEGDFEIKEKPIFVLGSGHEITYRQIVSNLGWAALFSLGILGIFLLLLLLEYHLSKKAIFQITDLDLKNKGMID